MNYKSHFSIINVILCANSKQKINICLQFENKKICVILRYKNLQKYNNRKKISKISFYLSFGVLILRKYIISFQRIYVCRDLQKNYFFIILAYKNLQKYYTNK